MATDIDADGDGDVATANLGSHDVSVLENDGTGALAPPVNYAAGTRPADIVAADLDGDGDLDLATANFGSNDVSVLLNTTPEGADLR